MDARIEILMVEDVADDAKLVERSLRAGGIDFSARRVETREDFIAALEATRPDVILCDCKLPHFDGRVALKLAKERLPGTPVIVVTGTILDHDAVALLREGAVDYVLKDRLSRLAPAVCRALADARLALRRQETEERYRVLFDESQDGIALVDCGNDLLIDCNAEFQRQTGRTPDELRKLTLWDLRVVEQARGAGQDTLEAGDDNAVANTQFALRKTDGTATPIDLRVKAIQIHGRRYLQVISRDVTQRREAERRLHEQLDELRRFQRLTVDRELRMEALERELRSSRAAPEA
jgi:PAS domain S-box-containing protein